MILAVGLLGIPAMSPAATADDSTGAQPAETQTTGPEGDRPVAGELRDAHEELRKNRLEERELRRKGIVDTEFGAEKDSD